MAGDRGEGPGGLPGGESSEPTICEVSNQLKALIEVMKTLVSDQRQTRERIEGILKYISSNRVMHDMHRLDLMRGLAADRVKTLVWGLEFL